MTVKTCRAYFELTDDVPDINSNTASIVIDYGDESGTGVNDVNGVKEAKANSWYTLDGRKLDGKPTKKGVYIYNGRKVVR